MVVIGDSLLIVITKLRFSFYSFIIQDNEHCSLIPTLTSTLSVCFLFLCFLSLLNPLYYLEQRRTGEILLFLRHSLPAQVRSFSRVTNGNTEIIGCEKS